MYVCITNGIMHNLKEIKVVLFGALFLMCLHHEEHAK
jgi:hypothetical protein